MSNNPFYKTDPGFTKLYIFGAGGFGREVAWLAEQSWSRRVFVEFVVSERQYLTDNVNGLRVNLLAEIVPDASARFVVALGNPESRRKLVAQCRAAALQETVIVHPRAELSRWIEIGEGTIVCGGAVVTTNIRIGRHVQVHVNCAVGHDVTIGAYTTLSPGAHISGHVRIGEGVFVGTGASIIDGKADTPLVIGDGAIIAAGACVTRSVPPGAMVAGVPAVRKR